MSSVSGKSDLIDIEMILHAQSPKAILVSNDEEGKRVWLPLSQIEFEFKSRRVVMVTMPEWLAIEKGIENG